MADQTELRRCDRVQLEADVDLRRVKDFRYSSALRDFSRLGCQVDIVERLDRDDTVWVRLPGLETLQAKVRWASEWVAGVEFDRPIHPAVFDHLSTKMRLQALS